MKILCFNCRSVFEVVKIKGKDAEKDKERKTVIRCAFCCTDMLYDINPVPKAQAQIDNMNLALLHDHCQRQWTMKCGRGRQSPRDALYCIDCKHKGLIDAEFCVKAGEYLELRLKNKP